MFGNPLSWPRFWSSNAQANDSCAQIRDEILQKVEGGSGAKVEGIRQFAKKRYAECANELAMPWPEQLRKNHPHLLGPFAAQNCSPKRTASVVTQQNKTSGAKPENLHKLPSGVIKQNFYVTSKFKESKKYRDNRRPSWLGTLYFGPSEFGTGTDVYASLGAFVGFFPEWGEHHHLKVLIKKKPEDKPKFGEDDHNSAKAIFLQSLEGSKNCSSATDKQVYLLKFFSSLPDSKTAGIAGVWTGHETPVSLRVNDVVYKCKTDANCIYLRQYDNAPRRIETNGGHKYTVWERGTPDDSDFVHSVCSLECKKPAPKATRSPSQCAAYSNSQQCSTWRTQLKGYLDTCIKFKSYGKYQTLDSCLDGQDWAATYTRLNRSLCEQCGGP